MKRREGTHLRAPSNSGGPPQRREPPSWTYSSSRDCALRVKLHHQVPPVILASSSNRLAPCPLEQFLRLQTRKDQSQFFSWQQVDEPRLSADEQRSLSFDPIIRQQARSELVRLGTIDHQFVPSSRHQLETRLILCDQDWNHSRLQISKEGNQFYRGRLEAKRKTAMCNLQDQIHCLPSSLHPLHWTELMLRRRRMLRPLPLCSTRGSEMM